MDTDYYEESVRVSLDEAGLKATEEQIAIITDSVVVSIENYEMARGGLSAIITKEEKAG